MNKKGFTLIELLAVIVVLSLIITVVATNGFGAFDNAKNNIDEQNKQAIIEGAKVLLVEIKNCDIIGDNNINNLLLAKGTSCEEVKNNPNTVSEFEVTLEYLKINNYVEGIGIDEIDNPSNYKVKININGNITLQ